MPIDITEIHLGHRLNSFSGSCESSSCWREVVATLPGTVEEATRTCFFSHHVQLFVAQDGGLQPEKTKIWEAARKSIDIRLALCFCDAFTILDQAWFEVPCHCRHWHLPSGCPSTGILVLHVRWYWFHDHLSHLPFLSKVGGKCHVWNMKAYEGP